MKINKLNVRGFGKFENFSIELSNGLNVIYGPNESGKSTLMTFIKAMLYGLKSGRAGKDGVAADIKRFAPWNNVLFGGYLNFELDNGSMYRIDRNFEKGEIKLFDSSFNDITSNFTDIKGASGIAEKLIGLNESIFERTVFVSQMGTRIDNSASKDLIDRISNMSQSGTEDISLKNARNALKEALKQQVGTDRSYTRPLDIINKRLEELSESKARILQEKKTIIDHKIRIQELLSEIDGLTNKEQLFKKINDFCDYNEKLRILYDKSEDIKFLKESVSNCENNTYIMEKDKEALEREVMNKVKKIDVIGIIALTTGAVISWGIFKYGDVSPLLAPVPILFSGLFTFIRIMKSKNIGKVLHQQLMSLNQRIADEKSQLELFRKRLESYNSSFSESDILSTESITDNLSEEIFAQRGLVLKDLTPSEVSLADTVLDKYNYALNLQLNERIKFIESQAAHKKIEYARLESALNVFETEYDEKTVDDELASLIRQKESLEQRGEALNIAMRTLEEAAGHVQQKYVPIMNKVFGNIFADFTNNKYSDIKAGDSLNIMINDPETDMITPVWALSNGTIDQMYMSLRIAIAESILKVNERLPFIMDEPFAQYDDERTVNALEHIYKISQQQQVIIFTCKEREADLIRNRYPCKICSLT